MSRLGREVLVDVVVDEGVTRVFGNAGDTELHLIRALEDRPELEYVLGLQENTVVAMAEGFARFSGETAFVCVHSGNGLGGLMGNLLNAAAHNVPMVIYAGRPALRHRHTDPMLEFDLAGLARAATKWQWEVTSADELAPVMRRAFATARAWPAGPVLVAVPRDVMVETTELDVPGRSRCQRATVPADVSELAELLATTAADQVAIVVDDEVNAFGAVPQVVKLAERLGADVYGAFHYDEVDFPIGHDLWRGMLLLSSAEQQAQLTGHDVVFYLGGQAGFTYEYSADAPFPPSATLVHLTADPSQLGRYCPTGLGLVGDIGATIEILLRRLPQRQEADARRTKVGAEKAAQSERLAASARKRYDTTPVHPMAAVHAVASAMPPDALLVDESNSAAGYVRALYTSNDPDGYRSCHHGGLGWAMPYAVGAKLAQPNRPVVCLLGDGSVHYSPQSLYTAAKLRLAVCFVVMNNSEYRLLRDKLVERSDGSRADTIIGMELDQPTVDFQHLASAYRVKSVKVAGADELAEAVKYALAADGPTLVDVATERG